MEKDSKTNLIKLVNSSGFPFQIAISNLIDKTKNTHGWSVFSSEHAWESTNTGQSGYVDLILVNNYKTHLLIIECKRVIDAKWIFLIPDRDRSQQRHHARVLISAIEKKQYGWMDLIHEPPSPETDYCVIRGQDKDSKPMLERVASELVEATESIAMEELKLMTINKELDFRRFYSPIILTTAQLQVCRFEPNNDIEISNGELSNAEFEEVPLVRFRKSLTTRLSKDFSPKSLSQAAIEKERTVFVINISYFVEILKQWRINWPWTN